MWGKHYSIVYKAFERDGCSSHLAGLPVAEMMIGYCANYSAY
jgi:hypothetical protein